MSKKTAVTHYYFRNVLRMEIKKNIKENIKDYSNFTFEDFLRDDFFIESVLNPTEKSTLFWDDFQKENKENINDFQKAVNNIRDLNKDLLDDDDVRKIWRKIQISNSRRTKTRQILRIGSLVAAASVAIVLIFRLNIFFPNPVHDTDESGIKSFALKNAATTEVAETRLILSDSMIVSLSDKESVILYDSTSIKVSSQETLKNEISKEKISAFNQLIIPKGKRSFLTLADGTRIWVNSGTRVVYPVEFTAANREIFVDGEIYLEVQPDKNKPFIVHTSDIDIQVLGTEFNVQAYDGDMQKRVVLKSGAVKITSDKNSGEIMLKPDEMFEMNNGREKVGHADVDAYISWINGIYICKNERLDIISARLSRYYGVEINVAKDAAALRCSGKLDLKENLNDVMNVIKYIVPINYTNENEKYTIVRNP